MPRLKGVTPRKPHSVVVGDSWKPVRRVERTQGRTITFAQDTRVFYRSEDGQEHRITLQSWRDWVAMYASENTTVRTAPVIEKTQASSRTALGAKRRARATAASVADYETSLGSFILPPDFRVEWRIYSLASAR